MQQKVERLPKPQQFVKHFVKDRVAKPGGHPGANRLKQSQRLEQRNWEGPPPASDYTGGYGGGGAQSSREHTDRSAEPREDVGREYSATAADFGGAGLACRQWRGVGDGDGLREIRSDPTQPQQQKAPPHSRMAASLDAQAFGGPKGGARADALDTFSAMRSQAIPSEYAPSMSQRGGGTPRALHGPEPERQHRLGRGGEHRRERTRSTREPESELPRPTVPGGAGVAGAMPDSPLLNFMNRRGQVGQSAADGGEREGGGPGSSAADGDWREGVDYTGGSTFRLTSRLEFGEGGRGGARQAAHPMSPLSRLITSKFGDQTDQVCLPPASSPSPSGSLTSALG